jgi:hypothetical protein
MKPLTIKADQANPNEIIDPVVYCSFREMRETQSLKPHPENPNTHSKRQVSLLADVIRLNGWRSPITLSDLSGFVIKGHCRLLAAQYLKLKKIPVDVQHYETEKDEIADLIADNRISELSDIKEDIVSKLIGKHALELARCGVVESDGEMFKKAFDTHVKAPMQIKIPIMILQSEEEFAEFEELKRLHGIKRDEDMFTMCLQKMKEG